MNHHFILVEYNNVPYPAPYQANIKEVAGHFDKTPIKINTPYSLHTEYSYGKRKFDTELMAKFPELSSANKDGVPQLWKSQEWADEFADFVIALTSPTIPPTTVEIHPPFTDYCSIDDFAVRFRIFEEKLHLTYPNTAIVIENRAGSVYRGGKFLFSKAKDIAVLCELIETHHLKLGIVLDFPQLLTAEAIDTLNFNYTKYSTAIDLLTKYQKKIQGIHIWGKKKSASGRWVAHAGTLDTYFGGNETAKSAFLTGIYKVCNDGNVRFLVPEVNSSAEDLASIIVDFLECTD